MQGARTRAGVIVLAVAVALPLSAVTGPGTSALVGLDLRPLAELACGSGVEAVVRYGAGADETHLEHLMGFGSTVEFHLHAWNNGTSAPGVAAGCDFDGAYLRVTRAGGSTVSTPAKAFDVGSGRVSWSVLGWLAGNEGVRTATIRLQDDADGGAHSPDDIDIIDPIRVKWVVGLRPDLIVKNGGNDPNGVEIKGVELYERGVRRDHQALGTDYDTAGWVAHVVIRNIGNMHAAEPNTMSSDPIGYTCTQTGVRLRDDTQTAAIVTDDSCTTSTKGLPYKVSLNLTPVDNGDGVVAGGEPRHLTIDVPTTVPLRMQGRFPCRPERSSEADDPEIHSLRTQLVSQCFLNATFAVGLDRAGEWNYTAFADPGPDDMVPERVIIEGTNEYQRDLSVRGAELRIEEFFYTVEDLAENELPLCGESPENACDAGTMRIRLGGRFLNWGLATAGGVGGAIGNDPIDWRFEGDFYGIQPGTAEDWNKCQADAGETEVIYGRLPETADCILPPGESSSALVTNALDAVGTGALTVRLIVDSRSRVHEVDEADNLVEITIHFA